MSSKVFLDSNIWLYVVDPSDSVKQSKAKSVVKKILKEGRGCISTQVIQEFYSVATRKLKIPPLNAKRSIELLHNLEVTPVNLAMILEAIDCSILSQISFWDGLIVIAAKHSGCRTVYSEDLSNRQIISGVRIINPFTDKL